MKAIVCAKYGPPEVLQLKEVERPIPKDNEILVKIHAANVTISDCIVRSGKIDFLQWLPMRIFVGFGGPRNSILGFELSGEVTATGRDIRRFEQGDRIFGFTGKKFGAYAEYVCLPENGIFMPSECVIIEKPADLSWLEAAAIPSRGALALHHLKKAKIQIGQKVLIFGASGGVGTFSIQIAKYFGADVTGVCSTRNMDLVKSLGADRVIDYTSDDFTQEDEKYDLIFDAVGKKHSSGLQYEKVLTRRGRFTSIDDGHPKTHMDELLELIDLIEAGELIVVIDRTYPLEQTAEAHRYVSKGHKVGGVVIEIP